jgi:hypothetical protein
MGDEPPSKPDLIDGAFRAALARLDRADDVGSTFASLGEVLFWVDSLHDACHDRDPKKWETARNRHPKVDTFHAIRKVRTEVAHAHTFWRLPESRDVYTDHYGDRYGAWVWATLPTDSTKREPWMEKYDAYLCGNAVIDTVYDVRDLVQDVAREVFDD